jgi:hypothetical protein
MRLWSVHPREPGLFLQILAPFLARNGVVLLVALAGFWLAYRRGARPERDGALLLLAGGLFVLPAMAKSGAWWNYLLPALAAATVLLGRVWTTGTAVVAGLALLLASTRAYPLPTAEDAATSRVFYAEVLRRGAPLLATRPDYGYFLLGQPVEVEGSSLVHLARAKAAGLDLVLDRLHSGHYRMLAVISYFWPAQPEYEKALVGEYRVAGACTLAFFYGRTQFVLLLPRADARPFEPEPAARCRSF